MRKASCVTFNNCGDNILVADKNGDVYHVPCNVSSDSDPSPKLLLGGNILFKYKVVLSNFFFVRPLVPTS